MKHTTLANTLKVIAVLITLMAVALFVFIVPDLFSAVDRDFPQFAHLKTFAIVAVDMGAIPIAVAIGAFWLICSNTAKDNSFSRKNAKLLSIIGLCALADTIYYFVFMLYLVVIGLYTPGILILGMGVVVIGLAIAVAAFLIARLVEKAAAMKEDSDLTI